MEIRTPYNEEDDDEGIDDDDEDEVMDSTSSMRRFVTRMSQGVEDRDVNAKIDDIEMQVTQVL